MSKESSSVECSRKQLEGCGDKIIVAENKFNLPPFLRRPLRRIIEEQREKQVGKLEGKLDSLCALFETNAALDRLYGSTYEAIRMRRASQPSAFDLFD